MAQTITLFIEGSTIRTARNEYKCQGNGSSLFHCSNTIKKNDKYLEYFGETGIFESGTRHCMECAEKFFKKSD